MTSEAEKPISIGVITGSMSRAAGGLFTSVRKSALSFHDAGANVTVHALKDRFSAQDYDAWAPLKPVLHNVQGPKSFGFAPSLSAKLKSSSFDVLHLHGLWQYPSWAVLRWKRQTGRPVMISPRGMLDPWALANSGWKKRLVGALFENRNLDRSDCLHALNPSEAASMRAYGLTNPIAIIPNGTDLPNRIGRTIRGNVDRKTLLFLGRIHPKKGLAELISAWAIACRRNPLLAAQWCIKIAGWDDGGHQVALEAQAKELGVDGGIDFVGPAFDEEKDRLLREADCFILPSFSEGLPMSVLEAWSYSLPVLMTRECNLPEAFAQRAAMEVTTSPEELATALSDALLGDDLSAIGQNGRDLSEREYAWPSIAQTHIGVYQWLLGRRTKPDCVEMD